MVIQPFLPSAEGVKYCDDTKYEWNIFAKMFFSPALVTTKEIENYFFETCPHSLHTQNYYIFIQLYNIISYHTVFIHLYISIL